MFIEAFLISLIIIVILVVLPIIFKSIFKTRKFMGYSMGVCCSVLTTVSIFMIFIVGIAFGIVLFRGRADGNIGILELTIGALIYISIFILFIYIIIFFFIFNYTKGISNPNQPYNCVFMFIAGYLLPPFVLIYLLFILASIDSQDKYSYNMDNVISGSLVFNEFFFLLYMIKLSGTIMLSMLHHRKVNKSILYILLICYFIPFFSILFGSFAGDINIFSIIAMVLNLAPIGFGVFFYCKYANIEYPKSELLNPNDM
jgi:hypothetical protein